MSTDPSEVHVRITTTAQQGREFLEKLAGDDDFRGRVEREPRQVLAEYGVHVPDHAIPATVKLPPKQDVEHHLARLSEDDELGTTGAKPHGYSMLFYVLGAMPLVDAR